MSIDAGKLRHRLTIQRQSQTQNTTTGEITVAWVDVATVWGAIEPLSAREFIAANAQQSQVTAKLVIRYRSDVDATMRAVHGSKLYNIEGVLPDKDSGLEYMTLPCSEGVNQGD